MNALIPIPRIAITIRAGELSDIPFLDSLQKMHTKQVGWMPTAQFEGKIKLGHVLIAEDAMKNPVGYVIGNDQYFKHDDIGIIYQLNVAPGRHRHLVGASLLKAQFDRSAWGCKLYCCWCAQDITANHFWEAMGFVALAFRAGSAKKSRIHIFWQKRIREGDTTTPWWFPSQTSGGSIREDRLVLPIPPGTHWSDAKPIILPGAEKVNQQIENREPKPRAPRVKEPVVNRIAIRRGAFHISVQSESHPPKEKVKREKPPKQKHDPKYVAAARELRDRYLEEINRTGTLLPGDAKYAISRQIAGQTSAPSMECKRLAA